MNKEYISYRTSGRDEYANITPWKFWAPAFAITDNIYYVGNNTVSSHLIDTKDGLILIDTTGYLETTYLLFESIRTLGFDPLDIKYVLNTHAHMDHVRGTRVIQEYTGAIVALGEGDVYIAEKTDRELLPHLYSFLPFKVDLPLKHLDIVELGDTSILCHSTPGHTAGTMTFTINTTIDGKPYTAGLFGGPGLNTLKKKAIEKGLGYEGNYNDFAQSIKYLKSLDFDVWLAPHPQACQTFEKYDRLRNGETPNPFIDKEGWKKFIDRIETNFYKLVKNLEITF